MKRLMKNINKFYKKYDTTFSNNKLVKADMYNLDTLMTAFDIMWDVADCYEEDSKARIFIVNLIDDLDEYIASLTTDIYKWKSQTMGNIVKTFGEVICQAWDSLVHYHTLDLKWSYNKRGF